MSKATERAVELHRTMTPHQMALRIVELEQQHSGLLAVVKAFHNSDFDMLPSFDEINNLIVEAEGQGDETQD